MENEKKNFDFALLAKYLMGDINHAEMDNIREWRSSSTENERMFSDLLRLRISWNYSNYKEPVQLENALERINGRINKTKTYKLWRHVAQYAAVLILVISCSVFFWETYKPEKYTSILVSGDTPMKKLIMKDGSVIWLRSNSEIKIPESFSSQNRTIQLKGEAFFDIAKDSVSHFIVQTQYMNIEVKGTSFNVKTDEKLKETETALLSGVVDLVDRSGNKVLEMSPGEKVTYSIEKNNFLTESIDVNICAAWRFNQFVFENATLREIVNQLAVKYNVNINIDSSKLANRRFRCVINEDEKLSEVLKILSFLAPISYRIEGREVFITDKK